jgi:hypothetical protein
MGMYIKLIKKRSSEGKENEKT